MRREQKSKTKIYVGYLTEIINYHLHFDFTVSHPSFFCPCVTDVDVRDCIRSQECWPRHNIGDNYGCVSVSLSGPRDPGSLLCHSHVWCSAALTWARITFLAGENCDNEVTSECVSVQPVSRVSGAAVWCSHCLYQDQAIIIIIINSALPTFHPKSSGFKFMLLLTYNFPSILCVLIIILPH